MNDWSADFSGEMRQGRGVTDIPAVRLSATCAPASIKQELAKDAVSCTAEAQR